MDFMYRGCIMPRVKKAKWNFLLNMQNPGCLLNDNGSAPCHWVADSVGCASKACWLTLKRPCVSWLWAFLDWTNAAERGLYECQSRLPRDARGMSAFEVIKTHCFSRQPSQYGRALWCAHVFFKNDRIAFATVPFLFVEGWRGSHAAWVKLFTVSVKSRCPCSWWTKYEQQVCGHTWWTYLLYCAFDARLVCNP